MDNYLEIAVEVLRAAKRPLSPRAILTEAYKHDIVPHNLFGKAQHKTLQARLSVDIVRRKEKSLFFRTAPGKFFLAEFLNDENIPLDFRKPIATRRRIRELKPGLSLVIDANVLKNLVKPNELIKPGQVLQIFKDGLYDYEAPRTKKRSSVLLRAFVCVQRGDQVLTYRVGKYREDIDHFHARRSIGFSTLVGAEENNLFSEDDLGITDAGIKATKLDLDLNESITDFDAASLEHFIWIRRRSGAGDMLAIITIQSPDWFEPTKRRLALNDLDWIKMFGRRNNWEDFDPWSKCILMLYRHYNSEVGRDRRGAGEVY